MASSRVFVTGLPPSISEDDFRSHFSKRHAVTDIKLLPQRRIGYVGYTTAEDAQAAVKYFNKSFLRMSKLRVEPARGFLDQNGPNSETRPKHEGKRARESHKSAQQPAKRQKLAKDTPPDGEENRSPKASSEKIRTLQGVEEGQSGVPQSNKTTAGGDYISEENSKPDASEQKEVPSDDADWMRSRTSRLLGLVDQEPHQSPERGLQNDETADVEHDHQTMQPLNGSTEPPSEHKEPPAANLEKINSSASPTRRLFLRNLAYTTTEANLRELLEPFGSLSEVQVPHDFKTGDSKGFAFAEYVDSDAAQKAMDALDGTTLQGRLLHVLPAAVKRESKLDEFAIAQMPLKKRRMIEKKQEASFSTFNWNSMFMNADAVLSSTAARLGVSKSEVFDPTSSDAAVKQAQAETNTIQATKKYFEDNGVNLNSFSNSNRNGRALLVKNFKFDTKADELKKLFAEGTDNTIVRFLMPPTGTIAIVEFANEILAGSALRTFAYRKFKDSILFLERAPKDLFTVMSAEDDGARPVDQVKKDPKKVNDRNDEDDNDTETSTLFVRNLNFITSRERLVQEFKALDGFKSAVVKTRTDPKHQGKTLSMGFGFLEFGSDKQAKTALKAINGHVLDGHELQLKASHKGNDAAADRRRDDALKRRQERSSKVVIKNLPFEASKKDVRNLFKSYGQLRALRMPKKLNNTSRGYAFAQFKTPKEAENALNALSSTHLLGRRLVLHYAADEPEDPEEQIAKMQQKVGKQSNSVALQKLTAGHRKKLNLEDPNEADDG